MDPAPPAMGKIGKAARVKTVRARKAKPELDIVDRLNVRSGAKR